MPSRTCAHRQCRRMEAIRNSFALAARKTTPIRTPMAATDVTVNRSTISEMISHAIPVSKTTDHELRSLPTPTGPQVLLSCRPTSSSLSMLIPLPA